MKPVQFHSVAQNLVEAIKPLVGERIVNIMETDGKIVASTDPSHVGIIHTGAAEAATRRSVVRITPEEAHSYPGSREGISLPVIKNGELLGVVGIHGVPDEVESAANLLGVCVDLYLDQMFGMRTLKTRQDRLALLLRRMFSAEGGKKEEAAALGRELQTDLRLPLRVAVAAPEGQLGNRRRNSEVLSRLFDLIDNGAWLDASCDACIVMDGSVVLIKHVHPGFDAENYLSKFHASINLESVSPVGVAMGSKCDDWESLPVSRHEAMNLLSMDPAGSRSIDLRSSKVMYLMKSCLDANGSERHLTDLFQSLRSGFGDKDMVRVMGTVRAYCDADCSSGKAAENLGIHKNTMNYRMNKIITLLGMEGENLFVREFFLRLLLLQYQRIKMAEQ